MSKVAKPIAGWLLCDLCNGVAHNPEPPHESCDNCAGRGLMPDRSTCSWTDDQDGSWHTTCDNYFSLNDGSPDDNNMKFCCFCGGGLVTVIPPLSDEDE